ncbi:MULTISPECIES: hypothetical protein [unclassified Streptomyces]|uniref:hypothetical protein n=1 Tax=unclassified Streptomyces TaxID=2593676 RepID=UPI001EEFF19B|nr:MULTISPECIES: hypothetical protein [unclassified Streptomyces]
MPGGVLDGTKTSTTGLVADCEHAGGPLPVVGAQCVLERFRLVADPRESRPTRK